MSDHYIQQAAQRPIAFAQVREDPQVELTLIERIAQPARVAMVASGGCTLAHVATHSNCQSVLAIDMNPAQLLLSKLKLYMLSRCNRSMRLGLLGYHTEQSIPLETWLAEACAELQADRSILGSAQDCAQGLDFAGRYEALFARMQQAIAQTPSARGLVTALLSTRSRHEQNSMVTNAPEAVAALAQIIERTFNVPDLVALFGTQATQNPRASFAQHFAQQTLHAIQTLPLQTHFMRSFLLGALSPGPSWCSIAQEATIALVDYRQGAIGNVLAAQADDGHVFDVIHVSNTLDWLSADEARTQLLQAHRAAASGGWISIRQLNSSLVLDHLLADTDWQVDTATSAALTGHETSFFYRNVYVACKR